MKDYYDELEVSHTASQDVINKAYKVLAKKYHPDTTSLDKTVAEERFKKISEAYETLSNEQKRKEYDVKLESANPKINVDDYNKVVHDNQILSNELSNLKGQINNLNNSNSNNSYNNQNNNQVNQTNQANYYNNNANYNPNPQTYYRRTYRRPYTFLDLIKYKLKHFLKSIFAFILTVTLIYIVFQILFHIPYTRNYLLDTLGFRFLYNLFN